MPRRSIVPSGPGSLRSERAGVSATFNLADPMLHTSEPPLCWPIEALLTGRLSKAARRLRSARSPGGALPCVPRAACRGR